LEFGHTILVKYHPWNEGKYPGFLPRLCYLEKNAMYSPNVRTIALMKCSSQSYGDRGKSILN